MPRHLLEIDDLSPDELVAVLDRAERRDPPPALAGRGVALVFEKPSVRTRNSMEMAVVQLGGHPVTIRRDEIGLDQRESVEDITRTLQCYHAAIAARVFEHATLVRMTKVATVPVVNLLSDAAHPMQALADLLTIRQVLGAVSGRKVAYVGDGNNVCRSLAFGAAMLAMDVAIATPEGYELGEADLARLRSLGTEPQVTTKAAEAVEGADVVYTDTWVSMGQEAEADERRPVFRPYQVDEELMGWAAPGAVFLHCLPVHRNDEVTAAVIDGPQSRIWPQAENRMHAARGLLAWIVDQP
jgi:ornithine carbamoyltransferase